MKLNYGPVEVIGEKRVEGFRSKTRPLNPFVSHSLDFDLTQISYDLSRALNSKSVYSVVDAESALVAAERRLYWNGYAGRSTRIKTEDSVATIADIRKLVFADHYARLRSGDLAHDILSAGAVEKELKALSRLGGSAINSADLKNLRSSALGALFRKLEKKILAYNDGPQSAQDTPADEKEYDLLVGLIKEYTSLAKSLEIYSPINTSGVLRSYCEQFAIRSADQALSSAISMSEATWFASRWLYKQLAESNIETAAKFAQRAKIDLPSVVSAALDLISAVEADTDYNMAREAAQRKDDCSD